MRNTHFVAKTLALVLLAAPLAACGKNDNQNQSNANGQETQSSSSQPMATGAPAQQGSPPAPAAENTQTAPSSSPPPSEPPPQQQSSELPPPPPPAPANMRRPAHAQRRIHDAAERFKTLAVEAHSANRARLHALLRQANDGARHVQVLLTQREWTRLSRHVDRLRGAVRATHRNVIRDQARAAYAILSGRPVAHNQPGGPHRVPATVARMRTATHDYRDALSHRRWGQMVREAKTAEDEWQNIADRIDNDHLRHQMRQDLRDMHHAAREKAPRHARKAAESALHEEARLEDYFRAR